MAPLGPERIGAERGRPVEPGDTLLTIGTGGVSIMALQVAQNLGAKVIILSGSDEKLGRARDLGAWATINHRETTDWPAVVLELTDGVGVDHVVEVEVGGPGTLERSIRSVRTGGRVSLIGVLSGRTGRMNPMGVLENNVSIDGIFSGSRVMFEALNRFVASSGMHPVIDRTFAFEDAASAYGYLETGRHFGKIVITR